MKTVDLRSDTVTRPSPEMRAAMARGGGRRRRARRRPDGPRPAGRRRRLLGKEAALYFPSGTMCNQAAVRALTQRGDEVFLHAQAHIVFYEQGAASALSQVQLRVLRLPGRHPRPGEDGGVPAHGRRRALGADPPRVPRADAQPLRRRGGAARAHPGRARVLRPARPPDAPRRRAAVQRRRGHRRERRRVRGALRHGEHLPVQGPRRARRLGARHGRRDPAGGGARPQGATAAACARPASSPPAASTPCATTSRASSTTIAGRGGWRRRWPRCRDSTSTSAACRRTWCSPAPAGPACRRPNWSGASPRRECSVSTRRRGRVRFVTHLDVDDEGVDLAIAGVSKALAAS